MQPVLAAALFASSQAAPASLPPVAVPPASLDPAPTALPPSGLVVPRAVDNCPRAAGSEIVVCGRRDADERHRLRGAGPSGADADASRGPIGVQISDSVRMEVEPMQRVRSDGWVDRRVVVRFRIAF